MHLMPGARRRTKVALTIALLIAGGIAAVQYRDYFYAVAWHCRHGNYATFPGYRVKLPLFWWEETDQVRWEQYFLERACAGMFCREPRITLTHVLPSEEASLPATDQEVLAKKQESIAQFEARQARIHHDGRATLSFSLATIRTPAANLVCTKLESRWHDRLDDVFLGCSAARFPYTVSTITYWQPGFQPEAESILSTLH